MGRPGREDPRKFYITFLTCISFINNVTLEVVGGRGGGGGGSQEKIKSQKVLTLSKQGGGGLTRRVGYPNIFVRGRVHPNQLIWFGWVSQLLDVLFVDGFSKQIISIR